MTLANEADKIDRFIHEIVHELSEDKEVREYFDDEFLEDKEDLRDLVALILNKWEAYKEQYHIGYG